MEAFQYPEIRDIYELQRITINLLALKLGFNNDPNVFHVVVESMKKSDLRGFAATTRNDIYSKMHARPRNSGSSNFDLQSDIDELLQERRYQGTVFLPFRSEGQPGQALDSMNLLYGIGRRLGLKISYSTDISLQLIAACGIALSQRGQYLPYDCRGSLLRDCELVYSRLDRFPCGPNVDASPQSRWSDISPRINHVQPIRPPQFGPLLPVPPPPELKEILSVMKRIEQKIDLNLNIGFSGAPPGPSHQLGPFENVGEQLLNIHQQIAILSHQTNQILAHLYSEEGAVGSRQQTDESVPPCTPAEQNSDDGQQISISSLCASLELLEPANHLHEARFMGHATQQATKFD
ncbi:hypothetical protein FOPG_14510 [Fusarium oxysporum f. sp. conglutinans race 2 54008]|uniref:Uncharacterized protein n=2 Tax=Fusarium oxysporum f. sp. conglutinans TaxID=100902 RepID=F9G9T6_FUSOF|nr:hypothetical protein FOXB_15418 [Fusarium oxysporum f. sp. conglutinans Fo5176]EXL69570.1 hypothetical protein FOPG_14510 [Fusarium oxysporum f. sp. conglutinans race 2 54008]KAG6981079.1 hypothetical protein FocnCong_v007832 [Fusarium oxysporum f. sp. conglutinans]KAI8415904.1 hypothetical protein FOFC_05531 [Fusarium oxysporum]KAI8415926.1 hypothetical protein FOFC_05553 [Fusarium oxysporum]